MPILNPFRVMGIPTVNGAVYFDSRYLGNPLVYCGNVGLLPRDKSFGAAEDDAEVLDEESSDPEIQLDLARAYISMGDKEAARVILEEVTTTGSEEQQAEAQKMLDLM